MIRKGQVSDAQNILDFGFKVAGESPFLQLTPEEMKQMDLAYEEKWIKSFEANGGVLLVAEVEGQIVGLLNLNRGARLRTRHTGVMGISVRKDYWNQGIGTKLIQSVLEWAKEQDGLEIIHLSVLKHNERAIYVYKKMGFQIVGERPRNLKYEDGTYADDVLMSYFL